MARQTRIRSSISRRPRTAPRRSAHAHQACLDAILVGERELSRVGSELHDGVCQELAGIAFQVQSLRTKLEKGGIVDARDLACVVEQLQAATRRARALSHGLHPVSPSRDGLDSALKRLAEDASEVNRLSCQCVVDGDVQITDPSVATHIYRVAQEAMGHAVRHGQPRHIQIELSAPRGEITLSIIVDGLPARTNGRLRADMTQQLMRHRAHIIGARLSVRPAAGGLIMTCRLPRQAR